MQYIILDISERSGINQLGRLADFKIITYQSDAGDKGSVKVEREQYSADYVNTLIMEQITEDAKLRRNK